MKVKFEILDLEVTLEEAKAIFKELKELFESDYMPKMTQTYRNLPSFATADELKEYYTEGGRDADDPPVTMRSDTEHGSANRFTRM